VRVIHGGRLTIWVGDDTSFQVQDSHFDAPAFNPYQACAPGDTADTGTLVSISGATFGPDFAQHPCGTGAPSFTAWTPVSLSPVTGTGSASDPFRVVVVVDAGATGLRLTETITHVAGTAQFLPQLTFSNTGAAPLSFSAYLATDMFLSIQYVAPLLRFGVPGGWAAEKVGAPTPACAPENYYALLPRADRYTGHEPSTMWSEIASGNLSNTMEFACVGGGIATEWTGRTLNPGGTIAVSPGDGVQFIEGSPSESAGIPTLDERGILVAGAALGLVGWILARSRVR
jgi:hypothetical protein